MKKSFNRGLVKPKLRAVRYLLLSLIGLAVPLGLGAYHRNVRGGESYHQFYKFPNSKARPVILRYGQGGMLHRLISPHALGGTLSLTNTGKPVKVAMRMVRVPEGLRIHWQDSHTRNFNLQTKEIESVVDRGGSIAVHHTFYIGENLRQRKVIFNGSLEVSDAFSKEILLVVPIRILNTDGTQPAEEEAPCHES